MASMVPRYRRVRSVPSPTICGGFGYLPLPRWELGHVSGFLWLLGPLVVLGRHGLLMVSRARRVLTALRVPKVGCVPKVRRAPSPPISGGFVYLPLSRWVLNRRTLGSLGNPGTWLNAQRTLGTLGTLGALGTVDTIGVLGNLGTL